MHGVQPNPNRKPKIGALAIPENFCNDGRQLQEYFSLLIKITPNPIVKTPKTWVSHFELLEILT